MAQLRLKPIKGRPGRGFSDQIYKLLKRFSGYQETQQTKVSSYAVANFRLNMDFKGHGAEPRAELGTKINTIHELTFASIDGWI